MGASPSNAFKVVAKGRPVNVSYCPDGGAGSLLNAPWVAATGAAMTGA